MGLRYLRPAIHINEQYIKEDFDDIDNDDIITDTELSAGLNSFYLDSLSNTYNKYTENAMYIHPLYIDNYVFGAPTNFRALKDIVMSTLTHLYYLGYEWNYIKSNPPIKYRVKDDIDDILYWNLYKATQQLVENLDKICNKNDESFSYMEDLSDNYNRIFRSFRPKILYSDTKYDNLRDVLVLQYKITLWNNGINNAVNIKIIDNMILLAASVKCFNNDKSYTAEYLHSIIEELKKSISDEFKSRIAISINHSTLAYDNKEMEETYYSLRDAINKIFGAFSNVEIRFYVDDSQNDLAIDDENEFVLFRILPKELLHIEESAHQHISNNDIVLNEDFDDIDNDIDIDDNELITDISTTYLNSLSRKYDEYTELAPYIHPYRISTDFISMTNWQAIQDNISSVLKELYCLGEDWIYIKSHPLKKYYGKTDNDALAYWNLRKRAVQIVKDLDVLCSNGMFLFFSYMDELEYNYKHMSSSFKPLLWYWGAKYDNSRDVFVLQYRITLSPAQRFNIEIINKMIEFASVLHCLRYDESLFDDTNSYLDVIANNLRRKLSRQFKEIFTVCANRKTGQYKGEETHENYVSLYDAIGKIFGDRSNVEIRFYVEDTDNDLPIDDKSELTWVRIQLKPVTESVNEDFADIDDDDEMTDDELITDVSGHFLQISKDNYYAATTTDFVDPVNYTGSSLLHLDCISHINFNNAIRGRLYDDFTSIYHYQLPIIRVFRGEIPVNTNNPEVCQLIDAAKRSIDTIDNAIHNYHTSFKHYSHYAEVIHNNVMQRRIKIHMLLLDDIVLNDVEDSVLLRYAITCDADVLPVFTAEIFNNMCKLYAISTAIQNYRNNDLEIYANENLVDEIMKYHYDFLHNEFTRYVYSYITRKLVKNDYNYTSVIDAIKQIFDVSNVIIKFYAVTLNDFETYGSKMTVTEEQEIPFLTYETIIKRGSL